MPDPLAPTVGWGVLHLFCQAGPLADGEAVAAAVKAAEADDVQVVPVAMLGHKADLALHGPRAPTCGGSGSSRPS